MMQSRPCGFDVFSNVSVLLDETGKWRMDLLNQNFTEAEAAAIKKLPHNTRRGGDRWAWSLTSHGGFSVKTAYHVIHSSNPRLSFDEEHSQLWKKIWRMKTLPSTKHFVWRVAKDILPTGEALKRRGVDIDGMCGMCGEEAETGIHAIIGCSSVHPFWSISGLTLVTEIDAEVGFKEWLIMAMAQWGSKDLELFAIAAQKVWERRNKARFGEGIGDISGLWERTMGVWHELNGDTRPRDEQWDKDECARWQPPSWRFLKLNVDASYKEGSTNRTGCIIRDYTGRCLAAQTKRYVMDTTVDIMEALAVFDGLEMATRMSISDIIVEGDSLRVFNLLNGKGTDNTRDANKVAHILAYDHVDFLDDISSSLVWLEDYPPLICNALRSDLLI
ncbi:uncharacterized protein G2W53_037392 [Senna tora]|uniref:Reverse transcriptase zinc-binding domain-containing protein n=1 Tax=Senna tora TaxID=362788 RepID=A0A834WB19_9FABA|nr:uncharacterized protein G2W53_037392 [Senna tora]